MIIVKLVGGLASQMHKYAIGRALAIKHNTDLKLDLSWFENTPSEDTKRTYVLSNYAIKATVASKKEIQQFRPNWFLLKLNNKLSQYFGINLNFKHYNNKSFMTLEEFDALPDNLYIEGEWAGYKYFEQLRDTLIEELSLTQELSPHAKNLIDTIRTKQSVSMHVRRGDYISNPHAAKLHCTCSLQYYAQALALLKEKIGDFHLFVFSDDIDWVKENFTKIIDNDIFYVEGLNDIEEFEIMSKCHHNIIANSGFSWFASWLNNKSDKIIIAPAYWVQKEYLNHYLIDSIKSIEIIFLENI